jgi:hypothetical protein
MIIRIPEIFMDTPLLREPAALISSAALRPAMGASQR